MQSPGDLECNPWFRRILNGGRSHHMSSQSITNYHKHNVLQLLGPSHEVPSGPWPFATGPDPAAQRPGTGVSASEAAGLRPGFPCEIEMQSVKQNAALESDVASCSALHFAVTLQLQKGMCSSLNWLVWDCLSLVHPCIACGPNWVTQRVQTIQSKAIF